MTDRELLELAAKAAGSDLNNLEFNKFLRSETMWNPLTDDGDALRLAVKLGLFIDLCYPNKTCGWVDNYESGICKTLEQPESIDPYAATRRAIVRAAAEIGKDL